jgi:hypothetical protein
LTQEEKERIEKNRLAALQKLKMKQTTLGSMGVTSDVTINKTEVVEINEEEEEEEEVPLLNKKKLKFVKLEEIISWSDEKSKRKYSSKFPANESVNEKISIWK